MYTSVLQEILKLIRSISTAIFEISSLLYLLQMRASVLFDNISKKRRDHNKFIRSLLLGRSGFSKFHRILATVLLIPNKALNRRVNTEEDSFVVL